MWIYFSDTGNLFDLNAHMVGKGYSGHGPGLNNQEMESIPDLGPIPRGDYTISSFFDDPEKGPMVSHLVPAIGTNDFGRSGFMLHGDNPLGNQSASHGCIVMPHDVRAAVAAGSDRILRVR